MLKLNIPQQCIMGKHLKQIRILIYNGEKGYAASAAAAAAITMTEMKAKSEK